VTDSTLEGVRILDMTVGLAPGVATLLLAESGADVDKLDPVRSQNSSGQRSCSVHAA
jgi:crotonobetainyl-CoA:carnitine CoA-transferase CaiB-like acyl-CoA transferase